MSDTVPTSAASTRRRTIAVALLVAITLGVSALTLLWSDRPPPSHVVFATGASGGAYLHIGRQIATLIESWHGPSVRAMPSEGSVDNLRRLVDHRADVAFVQGGIISAEQRSIDTSHLRAIARIYSEPLWVFYRGPTELALLTDLRATPPAPQRRIAIGEDGSGTQPIARDLLRVNGVDARNAVLLPLAPTVAADALVSGTVDVLFFVGTPEAPVVQRLLHTPGVRPMNFVHYRGYARRLTYLSAVEIEQGLLSLEENLPQQNLTLLAPSATLVTRDDVHPRVVELFTKAAERLFTDGNLIDLPGEYPSSHGLEVPQHDAARRYLAEGESWTSRHLPFWAVVLIDQAKLVLIPIGTAAISVVQGMPFVLELRVRRFVTKQYDKLRDLERRARRSTTRAELEACLAELDAIRDDVARYAADVSGSNQQIVFSWREHEGIVRSELLERLRSVRDVAATG